VQNGQLPANASPAQQWNAQPAPQQASPGGDLMKLLMQRIQRPDVTANDPTVRAQSRRLQREPDAGAHATILRISRSAAGPLANLQGERAWRAERAATGHGRRLKRRRCHGCRRSGHKQIEQELATVWLAAVGSTADGVTARTATACSCAQNQSQFTASQAQSMDQFLRELALREAGQNNAFDLGWAQLGI
jgi:hypothetical protein